MNVNLIPNLIISLRPKQWSKNSVIFAGLIFSHNNFNPILGLKVILGFGLFCLLAGSIYLFNDIFDLKQDQQHPVKRQRPIAAGKISLGIAKKLAATLLVISLLLAYWLEFKFFLVCLAYAGMMLAYSLYLKQIAILDVIVISLGFVLRAVAGAVVIDVVISPWLLVCTLFLALFLVLSKRRHELVLLGNNANNHRHSLSQYSPQLLDQMIAAVTGIVLLAYTLYTLAPRTQAVVGSTYLITTIPFVIFGIFRYLFLVYKGNKGGNPEIVIFSDKPLLVDMVLWVIMVVLILYVM